MGIVTPRLAMTLKGPFRGGEVPLTLYAPDGEPAKPVTRRAQPASFWAPGAPRR
jgi:hypothetical protein